MEVSLEEGGIAGMCLKKSTFILDPSALRGKWKILIGQKQRGTSGWGSVHQSALPPARNVGLFRETQTRNGPSEVHAPGVPQH